MDYLDIAVAGNAAGAVYVRLYIAATATFAFALIVCLRTVRSQPQLTFPHNIIAFTLVNGIIFRAISWGELNHLEIERSNLLSSYDYARIFFFTVANLTLHLIPMITAQRLAQYNNKSIMRSGYSGIAILSSYFIASVIAVLIIVMMGIGSRIPYNQQVLIDAINGSGTTGNVSLTIFLQLMDASNMLQWWFVVVYIILLVKYYPNFGWSYLVFCVLLMATQLVLTIFSFLPQASVGFEGLRIKLILQFVFVFQLSFVGLMISTIKGSCWIPPPRDYADQVELHDVPHTR